jgi:hypothetical protein
VNDPGMNCASTGPSVGWPDWPHTQRAPTISPHSDQSSKAMVAECIVSTAEDRLRDRQAERHSSLEIDHQLEPRRALDRHIGRIGTREYPADLDPNLVPRPAQARTVADQAAGPAISRHS